MREFQIENQEMGLRSEIDPETNKLIDNYVVDEFVFLDLDFRINAFEEVFHIYVNNQFFVTFINDIQNARIRRDSDTQKNISDVNNWIIERYIFPMLLKRIRDYHV